MEEKKKLVIAISGLNAVDNPAPGVGVARSIREDKELDCSLIGLSYDAMEPGNYMDWLFDHSYIMPYPSSSHEAFFSRLLYIKETFGLDMIIPTLDIELPHYMKFRDKLEEAGIHTFLPDTEQFKLRGKDQLLKVAKEIGIKTPQMEVVNTEAEMVKAVEKIGLPVMVKGAHYKAYKASTLEEASKNFYKIFAEWGAPLIIQQVIHGEEMNVVGVGDGEGNSLGSVGIKKLSITELGKIWTGVTIHNEEMLNAAKRFLKEYKWRSAFELECIISDGHVHLIEINPRFPAWSYFATGVGINLPANMVRKTFDMPLAENSTYEAGKLYIRYTYELITDMGPFQRMTTRGETEV